MFIIHGALADSYLKPIRPVPAGGAVQDKATLLFRSRLICVAAV